jgi:hypothetical protein
LWIPYSTLWPRHLPTCFIKGKYALATSKAQQDLMARHCRNGRAEVSGPNCHLQAQALSKKHYNKVK